MSGPIYLIPLAIAILALLGLLLRSRSPRRPAVTIPAGPLADFKQQTGIFRHDRFFPQIRQALSEADDEFLREVAPPEAARRARRERRAIARGYLRGMREDFSNLEQLGRTIAALSPVVSRRQETERLLLGLKFQLVYSLVWLRISTGKVPLGQLQYLTGLLGRLATRMEQAMSEINGLSSARISGGVSA